MHTRRPSLDLPVDYDSLAKAGSIMGSGGMVVMDEGAWWWSISRYFLAFTAEESCGKCMPCRLGTRQMLDILNDILPGEGEGPGSGYAGGCERGRAQRFTLRLGANSPQPGAHHLALFPPQYEAHILEGKCRAGVCKPLFHYEVDAERCTGCGACSRKCPVQAVTGEKKKPHVIAQDKCTKCRTCYETCKFHAVLVC